jgi:excisionase family DNA binding protein
MRHDTIEVLTEAGQAWRRAQLAETQRLSVLIDVIEAARAEKRSWSEIADKLGMSEGQAKWLTQRESTPEATARSIGEAPRTAPRPGRGPGVGVSEAARTLGVTRRTVYLWAEDGRLRSTKNELGKTRILLEDGAGSSTESQAAPVLAVA